MPLYEYECPKCGRFEKIQKFSSRSLKVCPTCGKGVERLLSAPAIQFKGSGWYVTDYARKSEGKSDSKGEAKGDEKSTSTEKSTEKSGSGDKAASTSSDSSDKSSTPKKDSSKKGAASSRRSP